MNIERLFLSHNAVEASVGSATSANGST